MALILVSRPLEATAEPNAGEPLAVVNALIETFALHAPVAASRRLLALQGIANTAWRRHFSDRPEVRGI